MTADEQRGLLGVGEAEYNEIPLSEDLNWLHSRIRKFVGGGIYLVAGQPGIGKSTLGIQLALDLGRQGYNSIYILTEQSKSEIAKRARLMTSEWTSKEIEQAMKNIHPEESVYELSDLPRFLTHQVIGKSGKYHDYDIQFIVLDSIQGLQGRGFSATATKQWREIYEFCRHCKTEGITTLLVAHVTKKGDIAGPKDLEHNVDCVLYMKKAFIYRPLFVPKNRFGPAVLRPIPLQMNRKTTALELSPHSQSVSSVARTFLGRSVSNAEAQAAVSLPSYGMRGRITAPGLPRKEIEQLLNCISQIPEMDIGDLDYAIQCRLPGERTYRRVMDLPLSMALIASYLQRNIPKHHIYIGELDLLRRVREVPDNIIEDLWGAVEQGEIQPPLRIFCPKESAHLVREGVKQVTVVPCNHLEDAIYTTWSDLRPKDTTE